jgi:hypothetical protein
MNERDRPDAIVVIHGPEDGAEYPIVRAPFYIGSDPSCAVNIRLDEAVRPFHAYVTAVPEGYRVRRFDTEPVYVDGKGTGRFRSRVVRSGGQIQVGNTLLCVECALDGLASRSYGVGTESDLIWAIRRVTRGVFRSVGLLR